MKAKAEPNLSARAIVSMTIELTIDDRWGEDCTIAQIHKQAAGSAIDFLRKTANGRDSKIKITSGIDVQTIIVDQNKGKG